MRWEPTRYGGFRRPYGSSSEVEHHSDEVKVGGNRKRPPVLKHQGEWGLKWREPLGLPECPYVIRWRLFTPFGSVRLHHWLGPDDDRAFHDHPWWFLAIVIRGGYLDANQGRADDLRAPAVRFRPALHRHTVIPHEGGAWTIMVTGPVRRQWGFWPGGKFVKANKWFLSRGHHPCDSGKE